MIILSNRVARAYSMMSSELNLLKNFAALRLRHCAKVAVTQQYSIIKNFLDIIALDEAKESEATNLCTIFCRLRMDYWRALI